MFQFSGFATIQYVFNILGFPIRTCTDQAVVCTSPYLFAAYHVLRRLQEPRHPPCALIRFHLLSKVFRLRLVSLQQKSKLTPNIPNHSTHVTFLLITSLPALSMNFLTPLRNFQMYVRLMNIHNTSYRNQRELFRN